MLGKIFRTGNSLVVSIPKDILDKTQQRQIIISPVAKMIPVGIDETFAKQVDEFIKEYRPALEALAK